VHNNGSYIYNQIYALGRSAIPSVLAEDGYDQVSSSNVPLSDMKDTPPRPLTIAEIREYIELYAQAAENAIMAGFDGVEIHGYVSSVRLMEDLN
jgi:NADPH2 dehydrogenase